MLQSRVSEKRLTEAFVFLRRNNIEPILIKGWAAARYYPQPFERSFSDIDLMVAAAQYQNALKILQDYRDPIDLHREAKTLDTRSFAEHFAGSELVRCGQTAIRVLCREDHLRVLCVHWLTDGGAKKDKLWDIYYAVKNRPANFDWEKCLGVVSRKRRRWILCTIGLAHRYLGLDISDLSFAEECENIPVWVIKTIEKEWESQIPLLPLHQHLNDRREFWRQVKKRFPPNAVQATINGEGSFDDKSRLYYQITDFFRRLLPSAKRILRSR